MLVFGDVTSVESSDAMIDRICSLLADASCRYGLDAHALHIEALIEAGELVQGAADARFAAAGGRDALIPEPPVLRAMQLATILARGAAASWTCDLGRTAAPPYALLADCRRLLAGESLTVKQPEGYAFYALYPEAYLEATYALCAPAATKWQVIGLRSIGTSLAAMVGAALDDPAPLTLRPVGHPFARRLALDGEWPVGSGRTHYAIVDEGPGMSGSSLGAVVRRLREQGIPAARIHLFAGHASGPGARCDAMTRTMLQESPTHVVEFDQLVMRSSRPDHRLARWIEALTGPLVAPLEDIGGGVWRRAHDQPCLPPPPVHPWQERRKFLARTDRGSWLVKFNGLGRAARERFDCARRLGDAGFSPAIAGLCHGFLVERWHGNLQPLGRASGETGQKRPLRRPDLDRLAAYIAFRALRLPPPSSPGASLQALTRMARHNTAQALGVDTAPAWERHRAVADALQPRVCAIRTDNRMHAWEWIGDGHLFLKTDAVDHHGGHDLVGCQDPAWDVAGASAEFELEPSEIALLCNSLAVRGCAIDVALLDFLQPVYLGFQLGFFSLAASDTADGMERQRLDGHARRFYADSLLRWIRSGAA